MDNTSEALFSLQRVAFRYNTEIDSSGAEQFGLVAEDVEKVHPGLIVHDKEGKAYSVRYDQVNAMLLNEFLKEHKKVQQQGATISKLQADATRQQATVAEMKMTLDKVRERCCAALTLIDRLGRSAGPNAGTPTPHLRSVADVGQILRQRQRDPAV
jgi:CRISPR/Cas system type I-B associated protein Csh2 (Cas7 group RAMP superfamily)